MRIGGQRCGGGDGDDREGVSIKGRFGDGDEGAGVLKKKMLREAQIFAFVTLHFGAKK